jgi:hypothetical protein
MLLYGLHRILLPLAQTHREHVKMIHYLELKSCLNIIRMRHPVHVTMNEELYHCAFSKSVRASPSAVPTIAARIPSSSTTSAQMLYSLS